MIPLVLDGASCADLPPDVVDTYWFPEEGSPTSGVMAKKICAACPVQQMCLAGARERREEFGTFGGETTAERRSWLRRNTTGLGNAARQIDRETLVAMGAAHAAGEGSKRQIAKRFGVDAGMFRKVAQVSA